MQRHGLGIVSRLLLFSCLTAVPIFADGICAPHSLSGEAVAQLLDSATTFCVGASGYSNEWYSKNPAVNTNLFNLLGDSAQFLTYHTVEGDITRSQWLSPEVAGVLTGTSFAVSEALSVVSNVAKSAISDTHVEVGITSRMISNNIKQTFTVTNIQPGTTIDWIELVTYLQYFPYGQANPDKGLLSYEPVPTTEDTYAEGLWAHERFGQAGLVREGGVCGGVGAETCTLPDHFMIGTPAGVRSAVVLTATNPLGDGLSSLDMTAASAAGALSWRVNDLHLTLGGSQSFTVELVPEPATTALFMIAAAGFLIRRRYAA